MIAKIKMITASWGAAQWVVIAVVVALCVHKVYKRQSTRLHQASFENVTFLERDIQEYNSMAERLGQMEQLPPVKDQWVYISAIAEEFGVKLSRESTSGRGYYRGPLESWNGTITGATGGVLVTAGAFQQTVPTYLHDISVDGDTASVRFAALGGR